MKKLSNLKKAGTDNGLVSSIIDSANEAKPTDLVLQKTNLRKSSIGYDPTIYKVLKHLNIEQTIKMNEFVNEAIKTKLEKEYPKKLKTFIAMDG